MMLVNGICNDHIEISDRGFQYGDGLFETIAVSDGQPVFFKHHLDRLKTGCQRLYIPFPDSELLTKEAKELSRHSSKAVLKLIITRGSGGRGYRQPDLIQPTRVLCLYPFPDYPEHYNIKGISARICETRLGLNPALAGIKHLNRLEQILARAEWNDADIQEGIMLDTNGYVIEGTMTNLFYIKNNTVYTSSVEQSGIAGIIRKIILKESFDHGFRVVEHFFTLDELLSADEMFVCNSIIGVWPIKNIANSYFTVGEITTQIQSWVAQLQSQVLNCGL